MKRFICSLLGICLLLSACTSAPVTPTDTSAKPEEIPTTQATTDLTTQPTTVATEPTTQPTEPPVLYRHPLNGQALSAPWTGRATAVVINNIEYALPHHGVGQADIFYEIETEGGITRCLAIYSDLESVDKIGPVRSVRTFFNNVAASYDATIVHCGGSRAALRANYDDSGNAISKWSHIDAVYTNYFFRDQERYEHGYAWEHTLFTSGEQLLQGLKDKGYDTITEGGTDYGLQFNEEVDLNGQRAEVVTVNFYGGKTTTLIYNPGTKQYEAMQYGEVYMDANTNKVMAFRNVMVLYTTHWKVADPEYDRSYYDLIGTGEGLFACNGEIVPITWSRPSLEEPFSYTLQDGTPVTLGTGSSYIAVVNHNCPATYQ